MKHVTNPDDLTLRFRGISSTSDSTFEDFEGGGEEPKTEDEAPGFGGDAPEADFIERF